ncbi:hypothetical protein [Oricola indica]|jgi:hypothetical protein|uniref:hypothetical protein n=1 Tax=Oricola indica TaxID=2872591 RepID=UPI001CBB4AC6|nr:hypothetical protein [Oricola indica]
MRQIIASSGFDEAVIALGGYRAIDLAMEPLIDGLIRDPYGFPSFESDLISFRYVRTKRVGIVPALVFVFSIDGDKNVVLEHVEEDTNPS